MTPALGQLLMRVWPISCKIAWSSYTRDSQVTNLIDRWSELFGVGENGDTVFSSGGLNEIESMLFRIFEQFFTGLNVGNSTINFMISELREMLSKAI